MNSNDVIIALQSRMVPLMPTDGAYAAFINTSRRALNADLQAAIDKIKELEQEVENLGYELKEYGGQMEG